MWFLSLSCTSGGIVHVVYMLWIHANAKYQQRRTTTLEIWELVWLLCRQIFLAPLHLHSKGFAILQTP